MLVPVTRGPMLSSGWCKVPLKFGIKGIDSSFVGFKTERDRCDIFRDMTRDKREKIG